MSLPADWHKAMTHSLKRLPPNRLAVSLGLPPYTPENVVRMIAGEMLSNNEAHQLVATYGTNNPTTPVQPQTYERRPKGKLFPTIEE